LAVDDDVGHADRQLPAVVIGGTVGNLLRIKDTHVSCHAFSQQPPVFQAEATGGVSRQMLYRLLQRPGLVVADMMSQIAGEAAATARMGKAAGEDSIATCHVGRVSHQMPQVFIVSLPVRDDAADRHAGGDEQLAHKIAEVHSHGRRGIAKMLAFQMTVGGGLHIA